MRIAVVTTSYPEKEGDPCGHFVRAEVLALERQGHAITVYAARGEAFGWPGVVARLREKPSRVGSTFAELRSLRARILGAPRFDRVVAHWCIPSAFPLSIGLDTDLHIVSHGGDVRLLLALPRAVRRAIVGVLSRRASAWRFVSHPLLAALLRGIERADAQRVEAIAEIAPSPIEMPDVAAQRAERRAEIACERLVVCVGRLVRSKRFDRVIEQVAEENTTRSKGTPIVLVIVGDGPERRRLEILAHERGVDARFVGRLSRPEALAWIGAADLLMHGSEAEGLSTVVREAEALGVATQDLTTPRCGRAVRIDHAALRTCRQAPPLR